MEVSSVDLDARSLASEATSDVRVTRIVEGIVCHGVFEEAWCDEDGTWCRIVYDDGDLEDVSTEQLAEAFAMAVLHHMNTPLMALRV